MTLLAKEIPPVLEGTCCWPALSCCWKRYVHSCLARGLSQDVGNEERFRPNSCPPQQDMVVNTEINRCPALLWVEFPSSWSLDCVLRGVTMLDRLSSTEGATLPSLESKVWSDEQEGPTQPHYGTSFNKTFQRKDIFLSSPSRSLVEATLERGGPGRSNSLLLLKVPCKVLGHLQTSGDIYLADTSAKKAVVWSIPEDVLPWEAHRIRM